jgi:hypothetical protein
MAIWRRDDDTKGDLFDDGLDSPGEDGFTRSLAQAHFGTKAFSYVGTPDWQCRANSHAIFPSPRGGTLPRQQGQEPMAQLIDICNRALAQIAAGQIADFRRRQHRGAK